MEDAAIVFENITKRYPDAIALSDISFEVRKNRIHGFLGANGAGKTTSMNILCCLTRQTSGRVFANGLNTLEKPNQVKQMIGHLPEFPPLYLDMKVSEYLKFVCALYSIKSKEANKNIDYAVSRTGLDKMRNRTIGNLSKGQKQRVGIAQAIVTRPEILVLDEPAVGLDPEAIIEIRNLLLELKQDHTVFLSTHQLGEVSLVCDDITLIHQGNVIASDTLYNISKRFNNYQKLVIEVKGDEDKIKEIFRQHASNDFRIHYKGGINHYEVKFNSSDDHDHRGKICKDIINSDLELLSLYQEQTELEEIYLQLTRSSQRQ